MVTRVHPEYLLSERNPTIEIANLDEDFWNTRMQRMVQFEKFWADNGTIVFKFYLHLSKAEQKKRLLKRIDKPKHQWKFSPVDLEERGFWDKYQFCYQEVLKHSDHKKGRWYIIPSDDKEVSRLIVSKIIYDTLKKYTDIAYPKPDPEILEHISRYKTQLLND